MPRIPLINFSGGINNSLEPYLIKSNEAVDLIDANIDKGSISPEKDKGIISNPVIPELTYQNGDRSIVRFDNEYFWSENSTGDLNSTLGFFGITPPSEPLKISRGPIGDRISGIYQYFYVYTFRKRRSAFALPQNIDINIVTIDATTESVTLTASDYFEWNSLRGEYVSSVGAIRYGYSKGSRVLWNGDIYEATVDHLIFDPRTNSGIGDDYKPDGPANVWRNVSSETITANGVDYITLKDFGTPAEGFVDGVDIFRTLANGSVFYYVASVPLSREEYIDRTLDSTLALREQYIAVNEYPPIYEDTIRVGGKYLTEMEGRFLLAVGPNVYQSSLDIHSWNPNHKWSFDQDVTAMAKFGSSTLVFLGNGIPWVISGSWQRDNTTKTPLQTTQGCPNWRTISYAGNVPVWKSSDGMCVATKRPTGQDPEVTVISENRYDYLTEPDWSVSHKDSYYQFFNNEGFCLIFDFKNNRFTKRTLTADYGYASDLDNVLYLVEDDNYYDADTGELKQFSYTSPLIIGQEYAALKSFKQFKVDCDSTFNYSIWMDDSLMIDNKMKLGTGVRDVSFPGKDSYSCQLKITSSGKLKMLSIEYQEVKR